MKIIVIGSLSANKNDQVLKRHEINSVQVVDDEEVEIIRNFDLIGEYGVASMAFHKTIVFVSGGNDLYRIDLDKNSVIKCHTENLIDAHEMDIIDEKLYITSTGNDICYIYDLNGEYLNHISLYDIFSRKSEEKDTFHWNQIFKGTDGDLYALVHHINGKQLIKKVAAKLLKSQGNGGVINLRTGEKFPLSLHAPHTVTVINNQYWVFDSGKALIKKYDSSWNLLEEYPTSGWGRGATKDGTNYIAGISKIRKRYLSLFDNSNEFINGIEYFNEQGESLKRKELTAIEQINNVYSVDDIIIEKLKLVKL